MRGCCRLCYVLFVDAASGVEKRPVLPFGSKSFPAATGPAPNPCRPSRCVSAAFAGAATSPKAAGRPSSKAIRRGTIVSAKPGFCENRLLTICSPDALVWTGTCPGNMRSGAVLKRSNRDVHSHLMKPYSHHFFLESLKRFERPRESTIWP